MAIQLTFRSGSGIAFFGASSSVAPAQLVLRDHTMHIKGVKIPGIVKIRFPELRISFSIPTIGKTVFPGVGGGSITTNDVQLYPRFYRQR